VGAKLYETFFFESYTFDSESMTAQFLYSFDGERKFTESIAFDVSDAVIQEDILDRCLELAFFVIGTSYYKCFPTANAEYRGKHFTKKQAEFINRVYRDGLSQFIFENKLEPTAMVRVEGHGKELEPHVYEGEGVLSLQSGGKDSLLLGELLNEKGISYTSWYMTSSRTYPKIIARLNGKEPRLAHRAIDKVALDSATQDGGLNGHVPVTFIALSYALIDAVLHGENVVLAAIGTEGNEPHAMVGDLPVNHQWSKTWDAERMFSDYVTTLISPHLHVGSPLRGFSELRIAELFEEICWAPYSYGFSSCNVANYEQGRLNTDLKWCGVCPKCANTFLLFSPFVIPYELRRIFDGVNLFASDNMKLQKAFKGLLGIDGVMKPLECVGEVEELRTAYYMAQEKYGEVACHLPFDVPEAHFDYRKLGEVQDWTKEYLPSRVQKV
jgi:hypothetical protein